jgi:hypothetical protein
MISISSKHFLYPQSLCEYQAAHDGKYAWFLCTWHPEKDHVLEEIQAEIKLEIINSGIAEVSKAEIEPWLKGFFADFHWKLHARLRKTELKEKGISLYFGVIFEREIYFVQFGRIFCALTTARNRLEETGKTWRNYQIQTLAELNLFGFAEDDIRIRTVRCYLPDNQRLLVLPGPIATRVFGSEPDPKTIVALVESYSGQENPQWLILESVPSLEPPRKRRWNKVTISTTVLLVATLLAILYMAFGNRSMDVFFRKARMLFSSRKTSSLEAIPDRLKLDSSDMFKYLEQAVNAPVRDIELYIQWSTDLPYQVTAAPAFNLDNIYLANENNLIAFNKKSRQLLWKMPLEARILSILKTQSGLVVILDNHKVLGIKETGQTVWSRSLTVHPGERTHLLPLELTNTDDPRIDRGITVIPLEKGIGVVDSHRGELLSELTLTEKLQYLSAYDHFDSCFYAVLEDAILCIGIKLVN